MAQAKVVKSKRGNDLIVLTIGPKEAATLVDALDNAGRGEYAEGIADAVSTAQVETSNSKYLKVNETVEFLAG
jgi:hypothetical protein